jgi:hypothetical protein
MGGVTEGGVVLTNVYSDNRHNLVAVIMGRLDPLIRPVAATITDLLYQRVEHYVFNISYREFRNAVRSPHHISAHCISFIMEVVNEIRTRIQRASIPIINGIAHAKNIELEMKCLGGAEVSECGICYDNTCGVKTGCGHEFCSSCVLSIIDTNKHKTSQPVCSFCRVPFSKLSVSDSLEYINIQEFINNLA